MSAAIAAAAVVAFASPAEAKGIADCVARVMPADARAAIVSGYESGGTDALKSLPSQAVVQAMVTRCKNEERGTRQKQAELFGRALAGYTLKVAAEGSLNQRRHVTSPALESAWSKLSAAEQAQFTYSAENSPSLELVYRFVSTVRPDITRAQFDTLDKSESPPADVRAIAPVVEELIHYAMGRATFESARAG